MRENLFREYGKKLKEYRELSGITQVEAAIVCGVSPLTVSSWECGRSIPNLENCTKLTNLYSMPAEAHALVKIAQMSRNQLIRTVYDLLGRVYDFEPQAEKVE